MSSRSGVWLAVLTPLPVVPSSPSFVSLALLAGSHLSVHRSEVEQCADQSGAASINAAVDIVPLDRVPGYLGRKVRPLTL